MTKEFPLLINKIDEFIKKYYKNLLLKGGLLALAALAAFFIIVNLLEYFGNFNITVRTIIFYIYIVTTLFILYYFVFIPLLKLYKIGKVISYEEAAIIIGKHFPEVEDKLLNTLQLQKMGQNNIINDELLQASIEQKIKQLKPIPFTNAINLKENKKYVKHAIVPLLIIMILLFAAPSVIKEPTKRIIHHNVYYEKIPPYYFKILNPNLTAFQQDDFVLEVKIEGQETPANVFVIINNNRYKLDKKNNIRFSYTFKNLQKNIKFKLTGENVTSKEYEITVLPRPIILDFVVELSYPVYTGKINETLKNTGDFVVPAGTKILWNFFTKDTRELILKIGDKEETLKTSDNKVFQYSNKFFTSTNYVVKTTNEFIKKSKDSLVYSINVIPDAYPSIKIEEYIDSILENRRFFKGLIKDDYGFSKMTFNYAFINDEKQKILNSQIISVPIPINKANNQQEFYYYFDMSEIKIEPGDEIEYFFEVWDNDGINGSKSTRSQKMIFKAPTLQEIEERTENANKQMKIDINQTILDTKKLQKDIEEFQKKLVDKNQLSWQEKQELQNLIQTQQQLQLKIDQLKLQNQINNIKEQQFNPIDEEIIRKQKELENLFENIMTPEMKELIRQMQEMLDKLNNKDQMSKMLEQIKLTNEDIKKELDRSLELFKQLEFEKKLQETIQKLDALTEKQNKLAEETETGNKSIEELKKEQDELNNEFKQLREDIKELEKKNSELEYPNKLKNTQDEQEAIQNEMKNSSNSLNKGKNKQASQSQKKAASQMEELSDKLQDMQAAMEEEQLGEDIMALREILENLIKISFSQENLMKNFNTINKSDPRYTKMAQEQKNLKDALQMVEDSLYALSKRQIAIQSYINREINLINQNADYALNYIHDRNISKVTSSQQLIMTSVNNLALLLSEALAQMQQQMTKSSSQNKSGASCKNPNSSGGGNNKPKSAKTMRQLQEQLNKQMEELKNSMQQGQKQNRQGQTMSEQFARMAAQQEAIRRMMQEYSQQIEQKGQNSGNIGELMKQMEQTELELVNKIISDETLKRQQEILTRLLESEKAEKERELDDKRESNEAKNENFSNPGKYFEYNKQKFKEAELLKTVPPSLKMFYRNKVNQYFLNFEE
ncbi:MAG TPA: hypothetical protein P5250_00105 [Bacteroidales bacterium]|nr:hypothetical protein [Bacteroidales bacterium]